MKAFACVLLIAAAVVAEPARFRQNYRFARQETEQEFTTARSVDAPYPAAGFKPDIEFKLPQETAAPSTTYGLPETSYGPPAAEYGPPEVPTTVAPEVTTTETYQVEGLVKEKIEEEPKQNVVSSQGAYYVLLPGSQLQRVLFQTENDLRNMAYTARLQYKDEDRAPLYVYTKVPQYQTSAAIVQVSGVQQAAPYQPSATFLPPQTYQSQTYQYVAPTASYVTPTGSYVTPTATYGTPTASYVQAW